MRDFVTLKFIGLMTIVVASALLLAVDALGAGEYRSVVLVSFALFVGGEVGEVVAGAYQQVALAREQAVRLRVQREINQLKSAKGW